MLKNGFKAVAIIILALLLHKAAFAAEVIELPPEELAQESVLPVFDKPVSVKNRNVVTNKRIEADIFYGYAMTEPIANVSKLGLGIYYNTSESSAWGLLLAKNFAGLSSYADQLDEQFNLKFDRAPSPELTAMLDYNLKAFYGKMSLSKSLVINTILFGSASAGIVKYVHKTYPAVAVGLGQKFYFTKNWSLRFDLRLYANQAPVPFLAGHLKPAEPVPDYSDFEERVTFTTNLDVGLSYLF
ncbi:outer membrane beta-barrel domain-containing protein [Bdellovibrio bacteriovorus]|uniref:Outer membrane beta-barrel domain-containing protein n=1 Tax=Bdellovibrio bacteriovorus TaxID=959 RepID=A0A150WIM0_BDEBC|nr:outer membrane beta-barrel domain-containing protein [Bdellovibrio bacteriovorus]KYG63476.1 outer membrane beta-barrel domain-containing protein [Bdellovibrio bacteriovorus]